MRTTGLVSWHPVFLVQLRPCWPHCGGGWLYDFRKVSLTSLGISLCIYKMTSLKRISNVCISCNVSRYLSALSSLVFAFCPFPDAHIFLGDKSNVSSDDPPSEMAHSLMTLFNSIRVMVSLIRYLLSIFRWRWWRWCRWCRCCCRCCCRHQTLWSRSCKGTADLDSHPRYCSPEENVPCSWAWGNQPAGKKEFSFSPKHRKPLLLGTSCIPTVVP